MIRDLLQAEWNVALEAFRTGRDRGIDLRYVPRRRRRQHHPVQALCGVGLSSSWRICATASARKSPGIGPARPCYIVATSREPHAGQQGRNRRRLTPLCPGYLGCPRRGMISKACSAVTRPWSANFKLWLTSTNVLERVLHNAAICQTDFEVDAPRPQASVVRQNGAYPRATDILTRPASWSLRVRQDRQDHAGRDAPLCASGRRYEPVVIKAEIAGAKDLFKSARKRVFY